MRSNVYRRMSQNEREELTRSNLKFFLLSLIKSEGFKEKRLERVLYSFCNVVCDSDYSEEDLVVADHVLTKVLGKETVKQIGYTKLEENKNKD